MRYLQKLALLEQARAAPARVGLSEGDECGAQRQKIPPLLPMCFPIEFSGSIGVAEINLTNLLSLLARPERFELPAPRFVVWCSIQLSYGRLGWLKAAEARRESQRGL